MTFTEEDAQNDGLIKKEAGQSAAKVASEHNPEVYKHFLNICDQVGQEPWKILGDIIVRSLNNEDYAQRVLDTDVDMRKIQTGDYRKEDIKVVKDIADEFDLEPDDKTNPIEKIIEDRISAKASSPLDNFKEDRSSNGEGERVKKLEKEILELKKELEEKKEEGDDTDSREEKSIEIESNGSSEKTTTETEGEKKDIDDIFGADDEEEDDEEEAEDDIEDDEEDEDIDIEVEQLVEDKDEEEEVDENE